MLETEELTVKGLLAQYGITTLNDFTKRAELSRQHAWLLWTGAAGVGRVTMDRFHELLGIPFEAMQGLTPVSSSKRQRRYRTRALEPVGDEVI